MRPGFVYDSNGRILADAVTELGGERRRLAAESIVQRAQFIGVDADPDVLHLGQHENEGILDRVVQLLHALRVETCPDRLDEVMHSEGIECGLLGR